MSTDLTYITAFLAGFLSFLSPCVLPLIPGYISFISGVSLTDIKNGTAKSKVIINSLCFVLGFAFVFVMLGASATFFGRVLLTHLNILNKLAGVIIVLLGLHMTGVFNIAFFNAEKRFHLKKIKVSPELSFLAGLAFAFGWSPCIGPILATILAIASSKETITQGVWLLSFYSLGLGLPFILTAVAIEKFFIFFNSIKKHLKLIEISAGLLLILLGLLIFTNQLARIAYLFG